MLPAFLLRAGIDWVRHDDALKDSNPYSRCHEAVKTFTTLWREQFGQCDETLLELAAVTSYWNEFFHAEDPLPDEKEWREGLVKRSSRFDSFEDWQTSFKTEYGKLYKDNNIWNCILLTAWAHTHQYDVRYGDDTWKFSPSRSYLPTSQMWRLEPHMGAVADILKELWLEEVRAYDAAQFVVSEIPVPFLGRLECLGFDTKEYSVTWPSRSEKHNELLEVGEMVANIVLPQGDNWYRKLDSVIFANDCVDITALVNRTRYVFGSRRRLLELSTGKAANEARMQAQAEGWLVDEQEEKESENKESQAL
jgi:hypothetical protein